MTGDPAYVVPEELAWVCDGDGGQRVIYLVCMDDLVPVVLEGAAALIWELAREVPASDIAAAVAEATGEPLTSVREAVGNFLRQLLDDRLLAPSHSDQWA